jgi:23S rRNA pseudouridine1911/1915/1917 synthase
MTKAAARPATQIVTPDLQGPLDRAVRALFGVSWGTARAWIESGKVRLQGEIVTERTARAAAWTELTFEERARKPRPLELADEQVVYADAHLIVVAKPAGISTVPYDDGTSARAPAHGAGAVDTLEARVRAWLERQRGALPGARPSLGIVHRLDKDTSGLVVFTRTWLAKKALATQFRWHTVHRSYLAIAHGEVRARTIRSFLIADRGDGLRGSAKKPTEGAREAVTHVEPVQALRGATLVACRLETGRTHQIRIHLSEAGHPIAGERVYARRYPGPQLDAPRLMLHAAELGFVHPATECEVRWKLAVPGDMQGTLDGLHR